MAVSRSVPSAAQAARMAAISAWAVGSVLLPHPVPRLGDDLTLGAHDHCAHRHLARLRRPGGKRKRAVHMGRAGGHGPA